MQKMRIGVLMGGKSQEREVSFNSGRTICDHLDTACYDIIPLYQCANGDLFILPWSFLHRGKTTDFEHRLAGEAHCIYWDDLKNRIDLMYIALHGRYAEDGTIQGMLELFKIPYVGSKLLASALSMDKIMQKKFLRASGIATPRDIVIPVHETMDALVIEARLVHAAIEFPCVVKPYKEGSSFGVSIAHTLDELLTGIVHARMINGIAQAVLVEEKIVGMEFSCIVLADKHGLLNPLMPTEIVTDVAKGFFDYEQKYMPGRSVQHTPARCSTTAQRRIQETAVATCNALELRTIARIDGFLTPDERVVIIDPNSFSGAAPSSFLFKQAAQHGLNHTQLINHLIKTELAQGAYAMHGHTTQEKKDITPVSKKRIAVLFGGDTNEREISLESGRNVLFKLSPYLYEPLPLFVSEQRKLYRLDARVLVSNSTREIESQLSDDLVVPWHTLPQLVDFVFIALHGGIGENGCIQGMLELLGLPYNGSSVIASALCMDKYKANQFLASQGFDVPRSFLISEQQWVLDQQKVLGSIIDLFGLPCIVKPHDDGCSVMVQCARTADQLITAIGALFQAGKTHAFVEELITGVELTGGVMGNEHPRALPPSQVVAQGSILSIEEKFLPGAGENQTPALLLPDALQFVQKTLQELYSTIGCKGYARIDCFYQSAAQSPTGTQRVIILEINTLPGLTPATCIFHQAAEIGMKPMEFIDRIIQLGFEEHATKPVVTPEKQITISAEFATLLETVV
ncbi:MAG: hypothetical protein WCE21_03925 [Candidatus Babeliales bacterium]